MFSKMLELTLALQTSLHDSLPDLIAEVNLEAPTTVLIKVPTEITLGIRTEMLDRKLDDLPSVACGVYLRQVAETGEQPYSHMLFPWVVDIYDGDKDATILYLKSLKWALVMDQWTERFGRLVLRNVFCEEAPDIDISYTLALRDKTHRQLTSAVGVFSLTE